MKTIKERTKKAFLVALSTVAALSLGAGVGVVNAYAENDTAKLESFQTGGASIRLVGSWGIRFQTTLDLTDYADLTAENSGFVTGVLAIPTDKLAKAEDLTLENENVANGVTFDGTVNKWQVNKDDATVMETYGYLDGEEIPELSYSRNISFRGYYTVGGETVYGNVQTRSLTYVAQAALYDDQTNTEKDVLSDTQEDTAEKYVKDYKVVYVNQDGNKLYENTVVSHTVENGEIVANNDEENRVAAPERFGYVFGESTVWGKAWNFESEKLTGDTVVKVESEASKTLDFSTATEVPTHLAVNKNVNGLDKEMRIDETTKALYGSGWASDTFTVSFAEPMTLKAGDKVVVEVNVPNERWFIMNLQAMEEGGTATQIFNFYTKQASVEDFMTVTYEAPEGGITFQTLEFKHTQSISMEFYVKSMRVEEANTLSKYDYYNVDFSKEETLPTGFVKLTNTLYGLDKEEGALWAFATDKDNATKSLHLSYPNIALKAGDSISITMKSYVDEACTNDGGIYMNGTGAWIKNFTRNKGAYETLTYTLTADTVLSSLYFWGYNQSYSYDLYIQSIVINDADVELNENSIDFNSDASAANHFVKAFSYSNNRTATLVEDETYGTVLKQSSMWALNGDGTQRGLIVHFEDLYFENAATITVTLKLEGTTAGKDHNWLAAGINGTENTNGANTPNGVWMSVVIDVSAGTTLSSVYLNSTTSAHSFNLYVASIVIS